MSNFDLIIFDCDGTLVDSELLNNQATSEVLTEAGFLQYTTKYCLETFVGWSQRKIWDVVVRDHGRPLPDDINQRYIRRVASLKDQLVRPAPGIADVLAALSRQGPVCVASNGEPENVRGLLEATDLLGFFDDHRIYTASQVENPKPAPDLFLYAASQYGIAPDRCLVVEDSVAGATAGVVAGMTVFGYTGLIHDPDAHGGRLSALGVHKVSSQLSDLRTFAGV